MPVKDFTVTLATLIRMFLSAGVAKHGLFLQRSEYGLYGTLISALISRLATVSTLVKPRLVPVSALVLSFLRTLVLAPMSGSLVIGECPAT